MPHLFRALHRRSTQLALAFLTAAAALSSTDEARADDDKRPVQDYGHPPEPTEAGDVLAWPVRVVLFPFFLFNEFILRRPLGFLVKASEKGHWIEEFSNIFTFGPEKNITVYPSILFDFGLLPSAGFNVDWTKFLHKKNTLSFHFGTWGLDWINVKATDTYELSKNEELFLGAQLVRRRDNPFSGLGPRSKQDLRVRFAAQTFEIAPGYRRTFGSSSVFETSAGARGLDYFTGACCGDLGLDDAIAQNRFPTPEGYRDGYVGGFQRASLALDTRKARPAPGSGFRLEGHEETFFDLNSRLGQERRSWARYGGYAGAALDVTGTQRTFALFGQVEFADPIVGKIPFTEQVMLGGDQIMTGYLRNRLIDRSAAVVTLQYTWPIWVFLDGVANVAFGNVWGPKFEGWKLDANRISTGLGIRSNGNRDSGFEFLVGAGTDPLDEGFNVSSFRLLIGSHHGL